MKLITVITAGTLLSSVLFAQTVAPKEEGIAAIKQLGGALKGELKAKMKEDPTGVAAAGFCIHNADQITKEINGKLPKNVSVRRASLKPRNSANKPDATDTTVMEAYNKAIASKTFDPKSPIKVVEEGKTIRVYKPLLTKAVCLKCHGSDLSPEISTMIKENYPSDQATGFKEGDLRGVIVAEVKQDQ